MKIAAVVPLHRPFSSAEEFAIRHARNVLTGAQFIVIAECADLFCQFNDFRHLLLSRGALSSIQSYNNLLLSVDFYSNFAEFEYLVIVQHDCIVLNDFMDEYLGYSYVGAPFGVPKLVNDLWFSWLPRLGHFASRLGIGRTVLYGNGGFSIRNVSFCMSQCPARLSAQSLALNGTQIISVREDVYWSWKVARQGQHIDMPALMRFGRDAPAPSERIDFSTVMGLHAANASAPSTYRASLRHIGFPEWNSEPSAPQ